MYVLVHGRRRFHAHEIENLIAMVEWLTTDRELAFDSPEQRRRLMQAVDGYVAAAKRSPEDVEKAMASMAALEQRACAWRTMLDPS